MMLTHIPHANHSQLIYRQGQFASELVAPGALALGRQLLACPVDCLLQLVLLCGGSSSDGRNAAGAAGTSAAAAGGGGNNAASTAPAAAAAAPASPGVRAVRLGLDLLAAVFECHPEARDEVLRACQLRAARLEACLPQVLLLARLCRAQPALLAAHLQPLKDCLSHFAALPPEAAMALLRALWPLCRARRELRDHVVMLLRKVMYGRDPNSRVVAVRGFVHLILEQLSAASAAAAQGAGGSGGGGGAGLTQRPGADEAGPSQAGAASGSQAGVALSQMAALASGGGVSLLQELAGVLRRALTQQAPVRAALYAGLSAVLRADPRCRELLAELLLPHAERYVAAAPGAGGADGGGAELYAGLDGDGAPPLLLDRCAAAGGGPGGAEPALVEPLPELLACCRRLAAVPPAATNGGGDGDDNADVPPPGSADEAWPGVGMGSQMPSAAVAGGSTGTGDGVGESTLALRRLLSGLRARLLRCDAETFGLDRSADLNPLSPVGALNQIRVSCLLGAIEVALEDAVADCRAAARAAAAGGAAGAAAARDAARYAGQLAAAFALHERVSNLARAGARAAGGKGKKSTATSAGPSNGGGKAAAAGGGGAAAAGGVASVDARAPQLSAPCLAALCAAITDDGLFAAPAGGWGGAPSAQPQTSGEGGSEPGTPSRGGGGIPGSAEHARLVRSDRFRAFVLAACANHLEAARREAAGELLLGGAGSGGGGVAVAGAAAAAGSRAEGWLALCAPLFRLATAILESATPGGGRHVGGGAAGATKGRAMKAGGGGSVASGGGGADGAGDSGDTLELLAARAVEQAVLLADAAQQLGPLARALARASDSGADDDADAAAGGGGGAPDQDAAATWKADDALSAALGAALPKLQASIDVLMRSGCFKAAHVAASTLLLLGKRLAAAESHLHAAAAAALAAQPRVAAVAAAKPAAVAAAEAARARVQAVSAWARAACQQRQPEVAHVPLLKALLEAFVRFSRELKPPPHLLLGREAHETTPQSPTQFTIALLPA